jgi:hypothetical protein
MQTVDPNKAIHPLRNTLTQDDWQRIQNALDTDDVNSVTQEELDAAHDVLYDAIVAKTQTHEGITTLQ